jgi:hypothetical protein
MTRNDFVNIESVGFQNGNLIVVSGPTQAPLVSLLVDTRNAIIARAGNASILSTFDLFEYPSDTEPRSFQYEYEVISAARNHSVVLAGNLFDPSNPKQNPQPSILEFDVVRDMINNNNVETVPGASDRRNGGFREIFSFLSRIYFYEPISNEVTLIKTQIQARP